MGLALSASAKDGSPSGTAPPAPAVKAKRSAKQKHWFQVGVASWYEQSSRGGRLRAENALI